MIQEAEIKRLSASLQVDPQVVEHDYILGCFLYFLTQQELTQVSWIFKGGTCLAKCYFPGYRFSEDLDFTVIAKTNQKEVLTAVEQSSKRMHTALGIQTDLKGVSIDTIEDDYGRESFEAKFYYRGPLQIPGSPRSVKVHISADEELSFPSITKTVLHPYSDKTDLPAATLRVYSLEEVFAEKLRALSGQRKYAIARDLFDLYHLAKAGSNVQAAIEVLPDKCRRKGIDPAVFALAAITARKKDFQVNWTNNLEYLVPEGYKTNFEDAWLFATGILARALPA